MCDDATVADYRAEPYVALLAKLMREGEPAALLMPASARGRDLAGGLAAELGIGVIADVTGVRLEGDQFAVTRPVYAGKLLSDVTATLRPVIITVRNRALPKPEPNAARAGQVTSVAPVLAEDAITSKVVEWVVEEGKVNLADARIIVSGGRGVGGPEGFNPVRDLAVSAGRRRRRIARGRGRRLDSVRAPGGPDRQDREPGSVHRVRHFGRHPAPGRHAHRQVHRRHQQRPRSAHVQAGPLWRRRRPVPDCPGAGGEIQEAVGQVGIRY